MSRYGIKEINPEKMMDSIHEISVAVGKMLPRRLVREHDGYSYGLYMWLLDHQPTLLARALRRYAKHVASQNGQA